MTDKQNHNEEKAQVTHSQAEMAELKRDMRSAQLADWAQKNQNTLIAGLVAFVLVLVGASFWIEHGKSQRESAATLYQQALTSQSVEQQQALLETVTKDYNNTGYAPLAHLLLARMAETEKHLQAVIDHGQSQPELVAQAKLDLAEFYLNQGDTTKAQELLKARLGKQYDQLRFYLLAEASSDVASKQEYLQKASDAVSHDEDLADRISKALSALSAEAAAG